MKINSHNEWDTLKEVVVGRPETRPSLMFKNPADATPEVLDKALKIAQKAFPDWLVDEMGEDLEELAGVMKTFGAKVHRPNIENIQSLNGSLLGNQTNKYITSSSDFLSTSDSYKIGSGYSSEKTILSTFSDNTSGGGTQNYSSQDDIIITTNCAQNSRRSADGIKQINITC